MSKKKVLVVGAGASGLPAIRCCLQYGFQPECYEKSNDIGGIWRYKADNIDSTEGSVMKSTVINTSKEMTAYSDFPPAADWANFMHNTKMLQYLRDYAAHHCLLQHVQFEHTVHDVRRADDYESTGRWVADITDNSTGATSTRSYDGVLCCTGHHVTPYSAKFDGEHLFKGEVLHSHSFRNTAGFEDKTVVVVGVGNSGGDVAVDLSRIAKQVYLVSRRGAWIVNRIWMFGQPIDIANSNRFMTVLRYRLPGLTEWFFKKILSLRFDHDVYGLKPDFGPYNSHVTVNDELPNRIACGTVRLKPGVKQFTGEHSIEFVDGTTLNDVDIFLKATGYSFHFPVLEKGTLIPVKENQVSLYQFMYDPTLAHPETLAIVGLVQPLGSIMPISEMQCRVFCDILSGRSQLPSPTQMKAHIADTKRAMAKQFVASRRHTIQVDYSPFMDELGSLIGCTPDWKQFLFGDPRLAYHLLFGPQASYHYRLVGPHPWPPARQAILSLQDRVTAATKVRRLSDKGRACESVDVWSLLLLGLVLAIVVYLFW